MIVWRPFGQSRLLQKQLQSHWQRLYRIAYSWCHDPELASDLVQETMRKALRKCDQLNREQALNGWLLKILTNCWRDHYRKHKDTLSFDDPAVHEIVHSDEDNDRLMIVRQVRKAIANLPHEQREVVTLVDLEGMSYREVADVLEIPIGTVMSRLCRARRQLKQLLDVVNPKDKVSEQNLWRVK